MLVVTILLQITHTLKGKISKRYREATLFYYSNITPDNDILCSSSRLISGT